MQELDRTFIKHGNGGTAHILARGGDFYLFGTYDDVHNCPWGVPVNNCGTKEEVIERMKSLIEFDSNTIKEWSNKEEPAYKVVIENLTRCIEWYKKCVGILEAL